MSFFERLKCVDCTRYIYNYNTVKLERKLYKTNTIKKN